MRAPRLALAVAAIALASLSDVRASSPPPTTLRALYGMERPRALVASTTALVLVDYQEEFFSGRLPVAGGQDAVVRATELLGWARARGILVVHVRNVSSRPDSVVFAASSPTIAIVPPLAPRGGELMITKSAGGAFTRTELDALLRARGIDSLIVGGIMTHLAVDSTARDGALLGYRVVVAADACATRSLPSAVAPTAIDAGTIHRVALTALADRFADVMSTREIVALQIATKSGGAR